MKCWGYDGYGELGNDTYSDTGFSSPVAVTGLSGVTAISVGSYSVCALLSSHIVKCWGYGYDGELGNNNTNDYDVPVKVSGLVGARSIATGSYHASAIVAGGKVKCWGDNTDGELGTGNLGYSEMPVLVRNVSA